MHWHIPVFRWGGSSGGGGSYFAGNRNELLARSFCISIFVSVSVFVSVLQRNESKFCAFFESLLKTTEKYVGCGQQEFAGWVVG